MTLQKSLDGQPDRPLEQSVPAFHMPAGFDMADEDDDEGDDEEEDSEDEDEAEDDDEDEDEDEDEEE